MTLSNHLNLRTPSTCSIATLIGVVAFASGNVHAQSLPEESKKVTSLPPYIAEYLRNSNHGGPGGCPESNIFVHGLRHLDGQPKNTIWFLGAPDYLCETNSFVSVVASINENFTLGQLNEEDAKSNGMLAGIPILFLVSSEHGYFVTSEWQIEGPMNFMYHSFDGETWKGVRLPEIELKNANGDCCNTPRIDSLCIDPFSGLYLSYGESDRHHGKTWYTGINAVFPAHVDWTLSSGLPENAICEDISSGGLVAPAIIDKSRDGTLYEISPDWSVRIPGGTL